ncbi:hypothetical protein, partial [Lentibacter algarum]|uniref:hypothetical protein n=1 Tax=Lentibacter algarum TaxID=576131 RepID=UPI0023F40E9B
MLKILCACVKPAASARAQIAAADATLNCCATMAFSNASNPPARLRSGIGALIRAAARAKAGS